MARFTKQPRTVDAVRWMGNNHDEVNAFVGATGAPSPPPENAQLPDGVAMLWVAANDAWLAVPKGDWILRDSAGCYPCKAEIFDQTYVVAADGEELPEHAAFHLVRDVDHTGISGTGVVAEGVQFSDGSCVIRWRGAHRSTVCWDSIESVKAIHGHQGSTRIVWDEAAAE